ncbi:MAG: hypothetical protein KBG20_08345 [Caldilineaceae bacterium]|nr:hypothetical protein [Caldilineaceae bacterium]MBP8122906.1 hypothetical protein [Caldilineaceae bacterium]MBP9072293.1 hypothetical protein [Caldilineaceae bacterium]
MKRQTRLGLTILGIWGMLMALLLGACGGSAPAAVTPAGMAVGQGTVLYFYTDA